jgi:probable rRNA maturation factor
VENIDPTAWPETGDDPSGVFFTSHEVSFELQDQDLVREWMIQTANAEAFDLNRLDVVFCSDDFLLEINKTHLNHDYYTDIITFPLHPNPIQAEVYISIDRVKENAAALNIPFTLELHRVIIHGLLHLCGYDDHEEKDIRQIRSKEEFYLKLLDQI